MSLKKEAKKLVLVLTTSTSITKIREETAKNAEKDERAKNVVNSKKNEYLSINFIQVLYIQYLWNDNCRFFSD